MASFIDRRGCMPAGQPFNSNADLKAGNLSLGEKIDGAVKFPTK